MDVKNSNNGDSAKQEIDYLVYRGKSIPKILRFAWTLLPVFIIYYLFFEWDSINQTNFLKDLLNWLNKAKG